MKRKVTKVGTLKLSPNEEAMLLRQERERRRKLRLQQVREQEKSIAQQIRQDVKERRDVQLLHLAEELRKQWQTTQAEKLRALERAYKSSLHEIGAGHRQAKENEPDLRAIQRQVAVNNEKAEKRHREALQDLKQHREKHLKAQTWHIKARKKALTIEKDRAAKIASLPPPPPDPLKDIEDVMKLSAVRICSVDNFSVSHHHLPEPYVDREMDTEQPDARAAAEEEAKRLNALQKEEERERQEQTEKANLRGLHALKMVHLTQDRNKLLKELEQMQQDDLTRRRQIVAQMPQQLFEPAYRRAEIREDWQRDLEAAFEDMYTGDRKVRGDMVLNLKPQPLPIPSAESVDEELDLSVEPDQASETQPHLKSPEEEGSLDAPIVCEMEETKEPQSKLVLKRLLNKIRTQKSQWNTKSDTETVSDTLESGSLPSEDKKLQVEPRAEHEEGNGSVIAAQVQLSSDALHQETPDLTDHTVLAGNSVVLHPHEQAAKIRAEVARQKKIEDLEKQKQEQFALLKKLDEERRALEAEYLKVQLEMEKSQSKETESKKDARLQEDDAEPIIDQLGEPEPVEAAATVPELSCSKDSPHVQMIREYQNRLVQQNRQHKQSVEDARKRLQEYQLLLKKRYAHLTLLHPESVAGNQNSTTLKQGLESHSSEKDLPKSPREHIDAKKEQPLGGNVDSARSMMSPYSSSFSSSTSLTGQVFLPSTKHSLSSQESQTPNIQKPPTSQEQVVLMPTKDYTRTEQNLTIPHNVTQSEKRAVNGEHFSSTAVPLQKELCDRRQPPSQIETRYRSVTKSNNSSPDTQSSIFTQDSETESYHPLPSVLSLGQSQIHSAVVAEPGEAMASQELHATKNSSLPFGEFSNVLEFRERLLSSTAEIQVQQDQLREMQLQLDKQRKSLLSKQKTQEEQLLQKQKELEEQMRKHQESLEHFLGNRETNQKTLPSDICQASKNERFRLMSSLLKALENSDHEDLRLGNTSELRIPGREQRLRPSKPPVTKTKLGPMLEQHELSAIQEVETPTSGRRSSTGMMQYKESSSGGKEIRRGDESSVLSRYDPENSRMSGSSDSSKRDLNLSRISNNSRDQSCNESTSSNRTSKLSWREMLSMEVASDDLSKRDQSSHFSAPHWLPSDSADASSGLFILPPAHDRSGWLEAAAANTRPSIQSQSLEAFYDNLSTTISTGSFLTSEKTDASPINSESSCDLQKCNYSIIRDVADSNLSPLAAATLLPQKMNLSDSKSPEAALNVEHRRSQIQQIIDKYTQDLSTSIERSLSFNVPLASVDVSGIDDHYFPAVFHSLEPRLDSPQLNAQTSAGSSQNTRSFLQYSANSSSREPASQTGCVSISQDPHNTRSFLDLNNSQNMELATGSSIKENQTTDSSGSFHHLHVECTLNETNSSSIDKEGPKSSVYLSDRSNTRAPTEHNIQPLPESSFNANAYLQATHSSEEIRRAERPSLQEDIGSFNELIATLDTVNESTLSEHPITDIRELRDDYANPIVELPVINTELQQSLSYLPDEVKPPNHEKLENYLLQAQNSSSSILTGAGLESSNQAIKSELFTDTSSIESTGNMSSVCASTTRSSACSFASFLPTMESESSHGILEEPELTLISFNDSSITGLSSEAPATPTNLSDHHEEQNTSESGFHALLAEVDTSNFNPSFTDMSSSQHFAVMNLDFTSPAINLQEAFLKNKKHFVDKSLQRLEEIKQKDSMSTKTDFKAAHNDSASVAQDVCPGKTQASIGQFKKVAKVKVCTPEDRKLSEVEMHHRTVRLYNQLDEVKTRKEEKKRLESYARNREKAQEFKKKTLEKLRTRNMK